LQCPCFAFCIFSGAGKTFLRHTGVGFIQLAISGGLALLQNQRKVPSDVFKTWPERQMKYSITLGKVWEKISFRGTELHDFSLSHFSSL